MSGIENYRESKVLYLPEQAMSVKNKDSEKDKKIKELQEALEREINRIRFMKIYFK